MSVVGLCIIIVILILAIFQPVIAPYPDHIGAVVDFENASKAPCADYWMGTDTVGRDIMSRIFYAFRSAFTMGLGVLAATVPIGSILGLVAGYWRGKWFSTLIMRVTDVFLALPPIILALCVCAVLRPTLLNSLLAMCFAWWPWYTRLTYSMATSLRNEMYIKSAELLGASKAHILFREILPNCTGSILTKATLDMGWVILNGATLSFVGLGEQPPAPALGTMVSDGAKYLPTQWWISIFPALAIMLIVLGFNLMGDGVKDMLSGKE
ncbi:MAG: ABC transporter permease [Oscillospiraceae bacterium]|nr:ABC transporter permease [Oscillospiraceae bacterium]